MPVGRRRGSVDARVLGALTILALVLVASAPVAGQPMEGRDQVYFEQAPNGLLLFTPARQTHEARVGVTASGFTCTGPGVIHVTLSAPRAPTGLTVQLDRERLNFEVPAGTYTGVTAYNRSQSVNVSLSAHHLPNGGGTYEVPIVAESSGLDRSGCMPELEGDRAEHHITLTMTPSGAHEAAMTASRTDQAGKLVVPGAGAVAAPLVAAAALLLRRWRG